MRYNFYDLSKLPIPGSILAWIMVEAAQQAKAPHLTVHDCPYGASRDPGSRCHRIIWRTVFRRIRQQADKRLNVMPASTARMELSPAGSIHHFDHLQSEQSCKQVRPCNRAMVHTTPQEKVCRRSPLADAHQHVPSI